MTLAVMAPPADAHRRASDCRIKVSGLGKSYGALDVFRRIDLEVGEARRAQQQDVPEQVVDAATVTADDSDATDAEGRGDVDGQLEVAGVVFAA